jgi:UDP-N-acetylmuramate--alanine ligase
VTNVDPEHLDHYGSQAALENAFVVFANRLPERGLAILGADHPGLARLAPRIDSRCIRYGFDAAAELRVEKIEISGSGQRAHAVWQNRESFEFFVPMPGEHNVLNALAALAVGIELGVALEALTPAFETFPGVARRFESKGEAAGIRFVDDYAHHPAEVEAVLAAARSVHAGRIVAIFQPHRYSRTRDCWSGFSNCFSNADQIVISEIYSAGESPIDGIDGERLAASISKVRAASGASASSVLFGGSLDAIEGSLPSRLEAGDLVLTLGAGDVVRLGPRLRDSMAASPALEGAP